MYADAVLLERPSRLRTGKPRRTPAATPPLPDRPCLGPRELARLARLPGGPLLILKGDCLARHGHPFYGLYALYSGLIEARVTDAAGHVRVLGLYRPGDIICLDALRRGNYPADLLATESSTVCAIPLSAIDEYLNRAPARG